MESVGAMTTTTTMTMMCVWVCLMIVDVLGGWYSAQPVCNVLRLWLASRIYSLCPCWVSYQHAVQMSVAKRTGDRCTSVLTAVSQLAAPWMDSASSTFQRRVIESRLFRFLLKSCTTEALCPVHQQPRSRTQDHFYDYFYARWTWSSGAG